MLFTTFLNKNTLEENEVSSFQDHMLLYMQGVFLFTVAPALGTFEGYIYGCLSLR